MCRTGANAAARSKHIQAWHRTNEDSRRLDTILGVGPTTASALVASVTDPSIFKTGRGMAVWIGLVARGNASGGKERLGRISKQDGHAAIHP